MLSLGSYATIPESRHNRAINCRTYTYLNKVNVDIRFGDTVAIGSACYGLVFVDRTTRYKKICICSAPRRVGLTSVCTVIVTLSCSECHQKHTSCLSSQTLCTRLLADSRPTALLRAIGRQWCTCLAPTSPRNKTYMPRNCWFHSIRHAVQLMNHILAKYKGRLASPFVRVHGTLADSRTWLSLFSVCYYHTKKDGGTSRFQNQAHTMDDIILGRNLDSNATSVYNPQRKNFCYPKSYRIYPHRQSGLVYLNIK